MAVIFLDRDGVINENRTDYVKNVNEFRFLPGSCTAIAELTRARYRIFVCTNQAGIARGLISLETLKEIHCHMLAQIAKVGGNIEKIYFCPHMKDEGCLCRKPQPGMLFQARDEFVLDLSQAVFVGDSLSDVRAGFAAGVQPILVLTGLGREQLQAHHQDIQNTFPVMESLAHVTDALLGNAHWHNLETFASQQTGMLSCININI